MSQYFRRRFVTAIPVFFGITILVFILMNLAPGDPTALAGEGAAGAQDQAVLEDRLGLNHSLPARYVLWLADLLRGDLGDSFYFDQPVSQLILQRLGPSLLLVGTGMILAVVLAVPLGVLAAWRPRSCWDRLSNVFTVAGSAVPGFFLALVATYVFAVKLRWLPASGMYSSGARGKFPDLLLHLLLPAAVIGLTNAGGILKQVRTACLEVMCEDYIITARAKGLCEAAVVVRHGLRSAMIPVLTAILIHIPHIIGGSVVVERIFGWPGMGSLMFSAINGRDYNVVMGVTVVIALAVLATSILLDLVYGFADARVGYGRV